MRHVRIPATRWCGVALGLDYEGIELNAREVATLERAVEIREAVREKLRELWGDERFDASDEQTLRIDELLYDWEVNGADHGPGVYWPIY